MFPKMRLRQKNEKMADFCAQGCPQKACPRFYDPKGGVTPPLLKICGANFVCGRSAVRRIDCGPRRYASLNKKPHPINLHYFLPQKTRCECFVRNLIPVETLTTCPIQIHCKEISSGSLWPSSRARPSGNSRAVQGTGGFGSCGAKGGHKARPYEFCFYVCG